MSDLIDPWHFGRPDLANTYLGSFDLGLTSARGLLPGAAWEKASS
jgi:hypothetical protein